MIVALNNKCNLNKEEFKDYLQNLSSVTTPSQLILCPTHLNLSAVNIQNVKLGSQNVGTNGMGAYTGEVSAEQLKTYNVEYCIIGHSERRQYQKESNEDVHKKIMKLFENEIKPILCIGETLEERQNGQFKEVLKEELLTAIDGLSEEQKNNMIVAYEPIWSIGTGVIPTSQEIADVFNFIKTILPSTKILYGGSANEENIDTLKQIELIDGYLLGGLSLKIEKLKIFLEKLN